MEVSEMEKMMHSIIEKQFENGLRGTNTHELYESVDIWKDLCEIDKMYKETEMQMGRM